MVSGGHSVRVVALRAAAADPEGLSAHSAFAGAKSECQNDLHGLIDAFAAATGGFTDLAYALEALALRSLARQAYTRYGSVLGRFHGARLDDLRGRLARLDKEIILATRKDLRAKISAQARPPRGIGTGRKSTWTDLALIANEVDKKKKHISVRELAGRASAALLELKPCWMMSPLAVAQYLPKHGFKFDLCIIDEASQMPPEEAIGALARSKRAMIVGDTNQLPPSNFFRKLIDNDGDDETGEDENVLSESILELANATFRPARRLRWHYRSKHSGLIKFSNRLVYNDDLVVFPSPSEGIKGMGVDFRAVSGLYKAGINPMEAQEMVRAAIDFMTSDPGRSLGIVTLNQKQRELIFEEMDIALNSNPAAMRYVEHWSTHNDGLEEFFIKNLENVQGDERDVIFIGTVYGPEETGARVMQRFGPINGVAGKRRLNVLFTRAKQQIVTFSSMNASDITSEPTGNEGAYMLKRWLEYSATGVLESGEITYKEPDSDFEIFVMNQIRAIGCIPVAQVGVKGYSIDIGVKHPQWAHGFILGVECDGAAFHSSKSARDRDRLRQEVLEGLGWRLHRIWSTDWFANPAKQAEILRGVIEARFTELRERESEFSRPLAITPAVTEADKEIEGAAPSPENDEVVSSNLPVARSKPGGVSIGDTVRVRYLTHDKNVVQFTISSERSDPDNGIIYFQKPIAEALLGAEEGDEVEILVGTYVRQAVLEKILTPHASMQTS
jgi:very-short-patch-repair endonuclease